MCNCISHKTMCVITYPCPNFSLSLLVKRGPGDSNQTLHTWYTGTETKIPADRRSPWFISWFPIVLTLLAHNDVVLEYLAWYKYNGLLIHVVSHTPRVQEGVINSISPWAKWPPFWQTIFSNAFSWMKKVEFWFKISLKFVPKGLIYNNQALVEIMAWDLFGAKPLSEPMLTQFSDDICSTRGRWVKNVTNKTM